MCARVSAGRTRLSLSGWLPSSLAPAHDAALAMRRIKEEQAEREREEEEEEKGGKVDKGLGLGSLRAVPGTSHPCTHAPTASPSNPLQSPTTAPAPAPVPNPTSQRARTLASPPTPPSTRGSSAPAAPAALPLRRAGTAAVAAAASVTPEPLPCRVLGADSDSREPSDLYTANLVLDSLSFLYAILFYQSGCGDGDEHVAMNQAQHGHQ